MHDEGEVSMTIYQYSINKKFGQISIFNISITSFKKYYYNQKVEFNNQYYNQKVENSQNTNLCLDACR